MPNHLAPASFAPAASKAAARRGPESDEPLRGDRVQGRNSPHPAQKHSAEQAATRVTLSESAKEASKGGELSDEDKQAVAKLKARDAEVRAHEHAHMAAAGGHTSGGIKCETQRGPDNKQYAVGGHVQIDTSPVAGDPAQTIQKAQTVRRAALAPGDPSGQDRAVAAKATQTEATARKELAQENREQRAEAAPEAATRAAASGELTPSGTAPRSYAMSAYARFAA